MTEIERAQRRAMSCLNGWVDAFPSVFWGLDVVQIRGLKQRLTAAFREYETEIEGFKDVLRHCEKEHEYCAVVEKALEEK